jgi:uncharacterized membrane protein YbhN (UPF0104 family)
MKKFLNFGLKLLVSAVLLYIFISQVDRNTVVATIKQTNLHLFISAYFIYILTIFISTKRWSLFLPPGLKYVKLVSLYFIGSFFNTFLPGLVGGDAVKAFYLYRHIGKGGRSLATVFMDRYMGLMAMACIVLISFAGGYQFVRGTEIVWLILLFLFALSVTSLILWKVNWGRITFLNAFYSPLMAYKVKRIILLKGLLLSFVVQAIGITTVFVISRSIGITVPIIYFFMFVPLISAASAVPVSVAGLGIREAGFVILFTKTGVSSAEALSLSLLTFTIMCMANLIGGIEYLRIGKPSEKKTLMSTD